MGSYHFDDFQLNLDLRALVRQGRRVVLGPKAYGLLANLVMHAGKVLSKRELVKHVWAEVRGGWHADAAHLLAAQGVGR